MYEPVYSFSSTDVSNYMYETVRGEFENCCTGLVLTTSCGFMGSLHLFLVCALHIAQLYVLHCQCPHSFHASTAALDNIITETVLVQ